MIAFTVPGQPQGKGRPRVGKIGAHARLFTPQKTVAYEGLVAHAANAAMVVAPSSRSPMPSPPTSHRLRRPRELVAEEAAWPWPAKLADHEARQRQRGQGHLRRS